MSAPLGTTGNVKTAGNDILRLAALGEVVCDSESKPSLSRVAKMVRAIQRVSKLDDSSTTWKDRQYRSFFLLFLLRICLEAHMGSEKENRAARMLSGEEAKSE